MEVVVLNAWVTADEADALSFVELPPRCGRSRPSDPGQPVHLVDHHHVDQPGGDVGEELLQPWPLHGAAGDAPSSY